MQMRPLTGGDQARDSLRGNGFAAERAPIRSAQSDRLAQRGIGPFRVGLPGQAQRGEQVGILGVGDAPHLGGVPRGGERHPRVVKRHTAADGHQPALGIHHGQLPFAIGAQLEPILAQHPLPRLGVEEGRSRQCRHGRLAQRFVHARTSLGCNTSAMACAQPRISSQSRKSPKGAFSSAPIARSGKESRRPACREDPVLAWGGVLQRLPVRRARPPAGTAAERAAGEQPHRRLAQPAAGAARELLRGFIQCPAWTALPIT
jgi:hypothetical protein